MIFKAEYLLAVGTLASFCKLSDANWGGHRGQFGGYGNSGNGHQGYGYGSGICAGARQRQGGSGGGFQHQMTPGGYNNNGYNNNGFNNNGYNNGYNNNGYNNGYNNNGYNNGYNNNGYNNNGYYQNPMPIMQQQQDVMGMPIRNSELDYRINLPAFRTTTTPPPATCSHPNARDITVFNQQCIFPRESTESLCSVRGASIPTGTTSITTCKSPNYYSDTGDIMLEICKDGKWQSDGKSLTCKSNAIVTQSPVVAPYPNQDSVVQYVQQPLVQQPALSSNNNNGQNSQQYYNNQYQQQPSQWTDNQFAPASSSPPVVIQSNNNYEPTLISSRPNYPSKNDWSQEQNKIQQTEYISQYPPPITTTTTTTKPTTTTTTQKPYYPPQNIDWRQYAKTNVSGQEQKFDSLQNSEKCPPLSSKAGMILECLSKSERNGGSGYTLLISDCQEPQPPGTEATYKCHMYFEPLNGLTTQYRKCKDNGAWTGNDDGFGCKLECGKSNPGGRLPLITYGQMTILGQWPWHAALFIRDRGDIANSCGGTLISSRAILTAAHCVNLHLSSLARELDDIRVDLGRYHREKDDPYVQKFKVEKIITHSAYNPYIFESDIAILILKEPAKIGFHVRPICFPKSQNTAFDEMQLSDGSYAMVVGWGVDETGESPDELRSAKIKIIGYRECIEGFEEADTGALLAKSTTFCAGNHNGTNVCHGDSGSGAFFAVKTSTGSTSWYLQGIVSLGINVSADDNKCDPERVSIFTRVSPYADWIVRVLSENDAM